MKSARHRPPRIPKFIERPEPLPPEVERLPPAEIVAAIEAREGLADWSSRLLLFAVWFANHYQWRGAYLDRSSLKKIAEDAVQDMFVAWLSGRRKFDPDKCGLFEWHASAIASIVDRLARTRGYKTVHLPLLIPNEFDGIYVDANGIADPRVDGGARERAKTLLRIVLMYATPDQRAYISVVIEQGRVNDQEASDALGWTIDRVRNVRRSLRRLFEKIRDGLVPNLRPRT